MKRVRINCTTTAQVGEAIEQLLWTGLYGNTRAAVVERLIGEAIREKVREGAIRVEELHESAEGGR